MNRHQFRDDLIPVQLFHLWNQKFDDDLEDLVGESWCEGPSCAHSQSTLSMQNFWEPDCADIVPSGLYFPCSDLDAGLAWGLLFPVFSVESLDLSGCRHLTDKGLAMLGRLTSLKRLSLNCCRFITGIGMGSWGNLTNLTSLDMEDCLQIVDAGLSKISTLVGGSLQHLAVSGCQRITDQGVAALESLKPTLSSLSVGACKSLSNSAMGSIAGLTQLRSLDISICTEVDNQGAEMLSNMYNLTRISMRHCWRVGDEGIRALSLLPTLRRINIHGCHRVSSEILTCLRNISTDYVADPSKSTA